MQASFQKPYNNRENQTIDYDSTLCLCVYIELDECFYYRSKNAKSMSSHAPKSDNNTLSLSSIGFDPSAVNCLNFLNGVIFILIFKFSKALTSMKSNLYASRPSISSTFINSTEPLTASG